jgi:hypothetical protein
MATVLSAGVRAQMLTQGPKDPGSSFNDVTFGTIAWTSPNNAMASDGMDASVSPGIFNSNYLHSDNFNFTVPAPAKIEGIQVDILRHSLAGLIKDARVRLVKGGAVGTTDKADTVNAWPTGPDVNKTYGGTSDLWGDTWTAADINMSNFGVVLSVDGNGDDALVDVMTMTVYYTLCPDAPAAGCRTSQKSLFIVKDNMDDSKDKIIWKFIKGQNTSQSDFANPTATATYGFCIYENGALTGTAAVPPSPSLWATISTKGYKYKDKAGASFGIQKIILKGGADGKSKVLVKGKGAALPDPHPPLTFPVKIQLVNGDNGICWESTFTSATKNVMGMFKAKVP